MQFPDGSVEARFAPLFDRKVDAAKVLAEAPRNFGKRLRQTAFDDAQGVEARLEAAQTLLACVQHGFGKKSDSLHSRYDQISQRREELVRHRAVAVAMEDEFKDLSVEIWQSPLAARAAWLDLCHRVGSRKAQSQVKADPGKLGALLGKRRARVIANRSRREALSHLDDALAAGRAFFVGTLLQDRIEREDRRLASEQASNDYAQMREMDDTLGKISGADVLQLGNLVGRLLATQAQDWAAIRETRPLEAFTTAWRRSNEAPTGAAGLMDASQTRWFLEAQSLARVINEDDSLRAAADRAGRGPAIDHCLDPTNAEMPVNLSLENAGLTGPGGKGGSGLIKP